MDNVGGYWDALYSNGAHADASYDGWLDTFRDVLARAGRVLELGAGDGADTGFLRSACASVLSCDLSDAALNRLKHRYPGAETMRLDLTEPMAFGKGTFEAVVADLCLHYFPLQKTREIFAELHRVLAPGGLGLSIRRWPITGCFIMVLTPALPPPWPGFAPRPTWCCRTLPRPR